MKILFVHQNFPGQFRHLAPALRARGDEVRALFIEGKGLAGIEQQRYKPARGNTPGVGPLLHDFESKTIRGEACARAALAWARQGYAPNLIIAHPGWGEALFLKDVWPSARLLSFLEFYYDADGADMGFDAEFQPRLDDLSEARLLDRARLRCRNAANLLQLETMDWGYCPTEWQRSTFPANHQHRISGVFDGVDTDGVRPNPKARVEIAQRGLSFKPGDELITFVNRNLEPYRGYHQFMRALPEIQRLRPQAYTLIVGGDETSYGAKPPGGGTWRQKFLDEVKDRLDMSRVIFVGKLPYPVFLQVLQVSACHVYLTYPFVLSWSCLEAMSAGALVVGSDTQPVREVIAPGRNGLLVDFFDRQALAHAVADVLAHPKKYLALREHARATVVGRYDLKSVCLPRQLQMVDAVAQGRAPTQF